MKIQRQKKERKKERKKEGKKERKFKNYLSGRK